ncbi:MAG: hypothetical protein ACR2J8_01355, partial [Thermomicrobiales bacterium]
GSNGVDSEAYSHVTIEDSEFNDSQLYAGASVNIDEVSTFSVARTQVTVNAQSKSYCLWVRHQETVTVADSLFTAGANSQGAGILLTAGALPGGVQSLTLSGTTTVTRAHSFSRGAIFLEVATGNTASLVFKDSVRVTGNTADTTDGSGLAVDVTGGGTFTVTGASGRVVGNTPDPQCSVGSSGTYTPVANCVYP